MRVVLDTRGLVVMAVCGAGLLLFGPLAVSAQNATGSISGRVVWGSCVRLPLPATGQPVSPDMSQPSAPDTGQPVPPDGGQPVPSDTSQSAPSDSGQAQPATPDGSQPAQPGSRPIPLPRGLPAGAVLVAVQNTALNTRTDETGRFTLTGVPAGTYLTIAAGPVGNATDAIAQRPNLLVTGGQSTDAGTLVLGGTSPVGIPCRPLVPYSDVNPQPSPPNAAP